jgi:membrane associated rhomboid family serine protease
MGIYDREYYRREGPSFLGSFVERGRACKWLIGINVAAFVIQLLTRQPVQDPDLPFFTSWFTELFELNANRVLHGEVWRLLTYAFLHDPHDPWHIFWNMALLWWFGSDVEDMYGPREFLLFYLLAALTGGVCFTLAYLANVNSALCLGASGAVTAVLMLCAIHFPTRIIYIMLFLPVPIWAFVLISVGWDAYQLLNQIQFGNGQTRVAVTVHLAGAAFAYLYYKRHWRLTNIWSSMTQRSFVGSLWTYLRAWPRQLFRPKLRVYREEAPQPVPVASPPADVDDEHLEAKLDAILEKVARSGRSSLTEGENQILMRASEVYKRRRS